MALQVKRRSVPRKSARNERDDRLSGCPQAVCIPHIAPIAAVVQLAHLVDSQRLPSEQRKIRVADIWMARKCFYFIQKSSNTE